MTPLILHQQAGNAEETAAVEVKPEKDKTDEKAGEKGDDSNRKGKTEIDTEKNAKSVKEEVIVDKELLRVCSWYFTISHVYLYSDSLIKVVFYF